MDPAAPEIPLIDVSPLVSCFGPSATREAEGAALAQAAQAQAAAAASAIGRACSGNGFFYIVGHGVDPGLQAELDRLSRAFFALPAARKLELAMERGGRAWRGYFPVGGELTSGQPDRKEGLYFGAELPADHPLVRAGTPMHGANLFPAELPALREVVLAYMAALTQLGHVVMAGIALSLGLPPDYFARRYTGDPLTLFRIFHYPADLAPGADERWGVGEHTDYGVLTLLLQDEAGGLQVKSRGRWIAAEPVPGSFVCNIGDMLDRMTRGRYRSTPHRVQNRAPRGRLSFPFFFDPNFHAEVRPIDLPDPPADTATDYEDQDTRWDRHSVHAFQGTYGDYLLGKVARVFPQLQRRVLP